MVSPATPVNGHRIAALVEPEAAEIVSIDGRRCLRVTEQRPYTDLRLFEQSTVIRPAPVLPKKPHLCVMVKMRLITHGGEKFIEANVFSVGFWTPQEADLFWSLQLCLDKDEAEWCEDGTLLAV